VDSPWLGGQLLCISNRYLLSFYIPSAYAQTFHKNDIGFFFDLLGCSLENSVLEGVYWIGVKMVVGTSLNLLDMGKGFVVL